MRQYSANTDDAFTAEVGRRLVRIHAATAKNPTVAAAFATDATFHAIRLDAYLEATAPKHPQAADALMALSRTTLLFYLTGQRSCLVQHRSGAAARIFLHCYPWPD